MLNNKIGYIICETASVETPKSTIIKDTGRRVVAETILQDMNVKNRNGRYYDDKQMLPALKGERITELLKTGNLKGENGHPTDSSLIRQQTIDPKCVSHRILKIWTEGNDIKAHVMGANSRYGDDFDQDLRDGELPSFSLRALGTVENTPRGAEVRNMTIITWDRVIYPSHPRAYTQGIVSESSSIVVPNNDPGMLIPITNNQVIDYIKHESANLRQVMETFEIFYDNIELVNERFNPQVKLTSRDGNIYVVNLETYLQNEIQNYCIKKSKEMM